MTIYRYSSPSRVAKIEERFVRKHVSGAGPTDVTELISDGWWVTDDGRPAYVMQAGPEKPAFGVGAPMRIIVEVEA